MISCVLLTAGLSERFGSPKALARLNNTTVIVHLLNSLAHSLLEEIIVVLGAHNEKIKPSLLNHKKITPVYNKDYNLGQTSSFKTGVKHVAHNARGIMLLPVDFPAIKTETINFLIDQFNATRPNILIPTYESKRGHPPIFHGDLKKNLLELDDTIGLNAFQHQHEEELLLFPVGDMGVLKSFNTPEEFEEIKNFIG